MRKLNLVVFLCFFSTLIYGQKVFKEKIGPCNTDRFTLEGDSIYAQYNSQNLLNDICNNLDKKVIKKLEGTISIQVIVDTLGYPCVLSIEDNLNDTLVAKEIIKVVNSKTIWTPPIKKNKKEKVSVMFRLTYEEKFIAIQRLGYIFDKGWQELDKYILKRK